MNSTTVDTTNIEVTNIGGKDGTTSASVADSTGVMTVGSSVLTTTDINGGTIDGTTIGGTTPAAITGTTITANTNFVGTIGTATQNSITTMTGLTAIGSTGNTTTFSGPISVSEGITANITGNADTATKIASITNSNIVQLTDTQTLTNKTLTSPTITGTGAISGTFTGDLTGDVTGNADTATKIASITNSNIVQLTDTQVLTNKTLTSPGDYRNRSDTGTFTGDLTENRYR